MKIVFLNTHSSLNPGDAGIVLAQAQFFMDHSPGIQMVLISRTPHIDKLFYKTFRAQVLPPLIPAPSVFKTNYQKIAGSLKNIFDLKSKAKLIKAIKDCDLVVCSGGGYFYSNRKILPGLMFFQNIMHVEVARLLQKSIVFFPQSFGPLYNPLSKKLIKHILFRGKTSKIFVREEISYRLLSQLSNGKPGRIETCPDMVFYLSDKRLPKEEHPALKLPRPVMALTLRYWDFPESKSKQEKAEKTERYLNNLEEVCRIFHRRWGGSVVIFSQVTGPGTFEDDRIISKRFWERVKPDLPDKNVLFLNREESLSPQKIMGILSQTDLIVATRFHSAVFALISGTPSISITYQPKSSGIMSMLALERFCVDIGSFTPKDILDRVEVILADPSGMKNEISDKIERLRTDMAEQLKNAIPSDSQK